MLEFRSILDSVKVATLKESREAVNGMKRYEAGRIVREGRIPANSPDAVPDKEGVVKDLVEAICIDSTVVYKKGGKELIGNVTDILDDGTVFIEEDDGGEFRTHRSNVKVFESTGKRPVGQQPVKKAATPVKTGGIEKVKEAYGDKRDHKKIDIYVDGEYVASTTWSASCAQAKEEYLKKNPDVDASAVKTSFSTKNEGKLPDPKKAADDKDSMQKLEEEGAYCVVVGNIGNIDCASKAEAMKTYKDYVAQSKSGIGRAAGESVALMHGGDIVKEYAGTVNESEDEGEENAEELTEQPAEDAELEGAEADLEDAEANIEAGDDTAALDAIDSAEAGIDAAEGESSTSMGDLNAECPCMEMDAETVLEAAPELADKDMAQVEMGVADEAVHSDDPALVGKIVNDHLEELPNYYDVVNAAIEAELAKDEELVMESKKTGKSLKCLKDCAIKERRMKESGAVARAVGYQDAQAADQAKDKAARDAWNAKEREHEDVMRRREESGIQGTQNDHISDPRLHVDMRHVAAKTQRNIDARRLAAAKASANESVLGSKGPTKVQAQTTKKAASPAKVTGTEKVKESAVGSGSVETPFKAALRKAMSDSKRKAKDSGTTAMSVDNWKQVTRPPAASLEGAPKGTNAQYVYSEMFRDLARGDAFVLSESSRLVTESAEEGVPTPVGNQPAKKDAAATSETGTEKPSEGETSQKTPVGNQPAKAAADAATETGTQKVGDTTVTLKVNNPTGNQPVKAAAAPATETGTEKVKESKTPVGNQPVKKAAAPVKATGTSKVKEAVEATRQVLAQAVADESIAKEAAAKFNGEVVKNADGKTWDIVAKGVAK